MKVVAWILFVLSILVIPVFAIIGALGVFEDTMLELILIGVAGFFVFGFISHMLVTYSEGSRTKDGWALFILTYPAFIIPVGIIYLILLILSVIDGIIYIATGKRYISTALKWFRSTISNQRTEYDVEQEKKKEEEKNKVKVYVVMDGYNKRKLKYVAHIGPTMDYNDKSPYNGKYYGTYIDDLGYYWRSYDDGKTFVKEDYKHEIV
ncbi:MAG: hypothetical protein K2I46_05575 [Clostridia bacterium]|nr:hypothetical protein [Clostridia bacterium]MDE6472139.1 hypothetical protein [Clostridia bacterium]